jgi:hypothetical protein
MVIGPPPGPAPAAHALPMMVSATRVELADVAEGESAQERPQRTGRDHLMAEHLGGLPGAQQVGVVGAVRPGDDRVHQGQHLASWPVGTSTVAKVHQRVDHLLDAEPLGKRGGQQQPGVGDRVGVVERDDEGVGAVRRWHRESALPAGMDGRLSNAILPAQMAFLIIRLLPCRRRGGSRLSWQGSWLGRPGSRQRVAGPI